MENGDQRIIVPETSDLDRVVLVLEAIRDGLSPHDELGLSSRQASYAIQTAKALGFVESSANGYVLTDGGLALLAHAPNSPAQNSCLKEAIEGMPLVREVAPTLLSATLTVEQLAGLLESDPRTNLAAATATKRAHALLQWRKRLNPPSSPELATQTGPVAPVPARKQSLKAVLVHISDMHVASDRDQILGRAEAIGAALAGRFDLHQPDACFIVFTGDITQRGTPEEFSAAGTFLDNLKRVIARRVTEEVHVILSPGNHDCDFSASSTVRDTLLLNMMQSQSEGRIDQEYYDQVCAPQANYQAFRRINASPALHPHFTALATEVASVSVGSVRVRFDTYNSAWCSQRHEKQGMLLVPLPEFPADLPPCDCVVALFHHPYNWLESNNARAFRSHVHATADIVLTGHEHLGERYQCVSEDGEQTEYLEGRVLQDGADPGNSGLVALLLDLETQSQETLMFAWDESRSLYAVEKHHPRRDFIRNKHNSRNRFPLSVATTGFLADPGEPHKHPKKAVLELRDIFVYPELRPMLGSEKAIREPLLHILKERRVLILGGDLSGKTSLAKRVFEDLYEEGKVPLLISGGDIKDGAPDALDAMRRVAIGKTYGIEKVESFIQLDTRQKALIVDDADASPLSPDELDKAVDRMASSFEYVIIIASEGFELRLLEALEAANSAILSFETSMIQPLGHARRYLLVEKWCYLGRGSSDDLCALSRRAQRLDSLLGQAMGQSMLPSLPSLVLLCLQQIDAAQVEQISDGSFGHLYHALITRNLHSTKDRAPDIDTKRKYLSLLAFEMYSRDAETVAMRRAEEIYDKYSEDFDISYPRGAFFNDLIDGTLLGIEEDRVFFRYKYTFCYFVASHFVHERASLGQEAEKLCQSLHRDRSANILLFMSYLDTEGTIQEVVLSHSRTLINEAPSLDLHSELRILGDSRHIAQLTLAPGTPESRRLQARERQDVLDRHDEKGESPEGMPQEVLRYIAAIRTVSILGQVLKGSPGSTPADRKRKIVEEAYNLSARAMRLIVLNIVGHHAEITTEIARLLVKQRPELEKDLAEIQLRVRGFLTALCEGVVYGTSVHVSQALGAVPLARTFRNVLADAQDNSIYQLIDLAIHLDHFDSLPGDKLDGLTKAFAKKPSPTNVLRRLVYRHLYLFPVDYRSRQRLCTQFNIKEKQLLAERKGRR